MAKVAIDMPMWLGRLSQPRTTVTTRQHTG
jgi:hypothetical protein